MCLCSNLDRMGRTGMGWLFDKSRLQPLCSGKAIAVFHSVEKDDSEIALLRMVSERV